jgi:phytoene/squalene synthetase
MDARADIRGPSLEELDRYCRVGVAVARLSICISGVAAHDAITRAETLGRALQLTNILRDLAQDANRGRLYLPRELLRVHRILTIEPRSVLAHPALPSVCREVAKHAEGHYAAAAQTLAQCSKKAMCPVALMLATYRALLQVLVASDWRRLNPPAKLTFCHEVMLTLRHGLLSYWRAGAGNLAVLSA